MPVPPEEVELVNTVKAMKSALVPMPIGKKQSYFDIFFGTNISVSLYLLVTGLSFILFSSADNTNNTNAKLLLLQSLGLIGVAIISGLYFFPLPALYTGVAGFLGITAYYSQ
jgi:hypothetical protein